MVNIASDVLGFFMMSLQIRDGFLSPFLKNITIDLSPTSGMISLVAEMLDELTEGLSHLLDDTG
jgi:hypothetical protein